MTYTIRPLIVALVGAAFLPLAAQSADVRWDSAGSGNWEDGINWDTGSPPTASDRAIIGVPLFSPTVTHAVGSDTIGSLSNNETLIISSGSSITTTNSLGVNNGAQGTLRVTGAGSSLGNSSSFIDFVNANTVEVLDGGALKMESSATGLMAFSNSGTMTFSGAGSVGSFRSLKGTFTESNTGTMTVTNGASLTLEGGPWTGGGVIANTGGTLNVKNVSQSFVQLVNTSGSGAITNLTGVAPSSTIDTPAGPVVKIGSGGKVNVTGGATSSASFLDIANGGTLEVQGGSALQLRADDIKHLNNGSINIKGGALADANLLFAGEAGPANLTGNGVVTLSKGLFGDARIGGTIFELRNGAGHTIQGRGIIETGPVRNSGNLIANAGGDLEVTMSLGLTNNAGGTIRGTGVGSRFVYARQESIFTNTGLVEAVHGGQVVIAPENVTKLAAVPITNAAGGTIRAVGAGSHVRLVPDGLIPKAGEEPEVVTNNGVIEARSGGRVSIEGKLSNLSDSGALVGGTYRVVSTGSLATTIEMKGNIKTNAANIELSGSQARIINTDSGLSALFSLTSNSLFGRFSLEGGANFTSQGDFSNAGRVNIGVGSTFTNRTLFAPGLPLRDYNQLLGLTVVNGTLRADEVNIGGGTLSGAGLIVGDLNLMGGTLAPGNSPGVLAVDGDYTQGPGGILAMELAGLLAGTEYDVLDVSGLATLGGTLKVSLLNGFNPAADAFFDLLLAEDILGEFANVLLPDSDLGVFSLTYVRNADGVDAVRLLFNVEDSPGGGELPPPDREGLPPPGSTVPLPSTLVLLMAVAAAGGIARVRRSGR